MSINLSVYIYILCCTVYYFCATFVCVSSLPGLFACVIIFSFAFLIAPAKYDIGALVIMYVMFMIIMYQFTAFLV